MVTKSGDINARFPCGLQNSNSRLCADFLAINSDICHSHLLPRLLIINHFMLLRNNE
jgi:hypothetical protein